MTASGKLIDDRVSVLQCTKAVAALLKHVNSQQEKQEATELLPPKEQHVWLIVTVKKMQPNKNLKPKRIPLRYPLVDPRTTAVCLITKDPQREYKDLLEAKGIKFVSRVVGLEKLKGKFKGFDARRLLLKENGLFLADDRVVPLLPKLLGKEWFKAKKQPIPVSLKKTDLKGELESAISSSYMHQNQGTCTSVKVATTSHTESQVLANLKTALPAIVSRLEGGWDNIQSLNIKTSTSVSLPIWTCPLGHDEPGSRWEGMDVNEEEEWGGIDSGSVEDGGIETSATSALIVSSKDKSSGKGKKRTADVVSNEDEEKTQKKKTRTTKGMTLALVDGKAIDGVMVRKPKTDATDPSASSKKLRKKRGSNSAESVSEGDHSVSTMTAKELKEKKVETTKREKKSKVKSSLKTDPKAQLVGRKKLS